MLLELYHVDAARKLKGDALVTFPGGDKTIRRIERVFVVDRGRETIDYLTPDLEYTSAVLVDQRITGGNANQVEVYRAWEEFPGVVISTTRTDDDGATVTITHQRRLATDIVTSESTSGSTWLRKWRGDGNAVAAEQVTESRSIPGTEYTKAAQTDEYGNLIATKTKLVVAATATSLTSDATKEESYEAIDAAAGHLITKAMPESFAEVDEIEQVDPEVPGSRATVSWKIVTAASSIPADTSTTTYRRIKHPTNPTLKIQIKTVYAIPSSFEETDENSHSFPEIFRSATLNATFGMYWNFRPGFSEVVPCRVAHSFGTTKNEPVPTIVREASWRYPLGFSGRALTAAELMTFTSGGTTITINLPASTPSSTTYDSWVAGSTELLLGGSSRIWHAGIYHTIEIYAKSR